MAARAKLGRDVVARAVAEEEARGLEEEHQREHHAHSCGGGGVELAHEECVSDVVEVGHKHRHNGGQGHREYHAVDGTGGEEGVVVSLFCQTLIPYYICISCPARFRAAHRRTRASPSPEWRLPRRPRRLATGLGPALARCKGRCFFPIHQKQRREKTKMENEDGERPGGRPQQTTTDKHRPHFENRQTKRSVSPENYYTMQAKLLFCIFFLKNIWVVLIYFLYLPTESRKNGSRWRGNR